MFDFSLWGILSFISCFVYQLALMEYATTVLEKNSRKIILKIVFALLNTMAILFFNMPFWYLYVVCTAVLLLQFKLLSGAGLRQAFAGATIFCVNISSIHFLVIALYIQLASILPNEFISDRLHRQRTIVLTFIILLIVLIVVKKVIPLRDIKRVTTAKLYSVMLSSVAFLFILHFSVGIYIYFRYNDFADRLQFVIINTVMMILILYFVLLYVINFVNLHEYKRYADELGETYSNIQSQKKSLAIKVERDELTQLYNRKYINQVLDKIFSMPSEGFGLLYIDVNRLKYVNDNFGHHKGDKLITCVADVLRKVLREGDISARIGGDEFLVIVDNVNSDEQLDLITKRIEELLFVHDEIEDYPVSASIGGAYINEEIKELGVGEAIALADSMMRKNKTRFYDREGRYVK